MTPAIGRATASIFMAMDPRVKQGVLRRVDAMERELTFLAEREDGNLMYLGGRGWDAERLQMVFVLNSVYQHVLGPLQAAARAGPEGLGSRIPVRHGSSSFSQSTAGTIRIAMRDFLRLTSELKVLQAWLHLNTCGDVVFSIAGFERESSRS